MIRLRAALTLAGFVATAARAAVVHSPLSPAEARPAAVVDLATSDGAALVSATWRYADARLVEIDSPTVGPDLRPSGPPGRTLDVHPAAGVAGFDDSAWPEVGPEALTARRGGGRVSFGWYRLRLVLPERVGALSIRGTTVVFEIVVDDAAEVWVDGALPVVLGQTSGGVARGFNAPNRVVLTRDARAGESHEIAVFASNGPVSASPRNFIWVRSATLDVYAPAAGEAESHGTVERVSPALDRIVPPEARIEKLADGFLFTEGPVWHPDGYLLFSDPNANTVYRWSAVDGVSVYRTKSGYAGADLGALGQPGSNGLTLDAEGRLTIDEHGRRRVSRLERNGVVTVLADRFEGRRLNSPNDLVYRSDGALYFTDPPFGLPRFFEDPGKELPTSGVFLLKDGRLRRAADDLTGPNGIAFSPDERFLYVSNWDPRRKVVLRYAVAADGTLSSPTVFFDVTSLPGDEALDGLKVDTEGNVYVSAPGGVWIVSPEGRHLGTIHVEERPANFAWGDADGRTLYMTARTGLYRIRLGVPGIRPPLPKR
ncbi:MAG TPA: SMP-30/gluconolactonase/LRE family protein [Vicinamibacteria bacterium]|nr:SMP-30/gluconolactonase/LRE family protein [Vicinamibacteria bacterium]